MGTIEMSHKIDMFKIRLKILELKRQTIVNIDELDDIRIGLKEVEKDFKEFIKYRKERDLELRKNLDAM